MILRVIRVLFSCVAILALSVCRSASDDPVGPSLVNLEARGFVMGGLASPVFLTQPLNDSRIFVVERAGRIRVVRNGALQTAPFLDISAKVQSGSTEQGLFSVAFHPQYATNRFFYVYYTTQTIGALTGGDIVVERYTATSNPEVADPASAKLIITTPHWRQTNHNGGLVSFGLDGMLYAGFGDGGGSGDPYRTGQNPDSLLGSLLRLDVNTGDPYSTPATNPYAGQPPRRGEIWAKGLRNPWRYAFDAPTGLLYIADVGQNSREEISVAPASLAGVNYGWSIMEGATCYNAASCTQTGLRLPVLDYATHVSGTCSVTGGYVYRGSAIPEIQGLYFYSDYCAGFLRSFRYANGVAADQRDWGLSLGNVASFGVDFAGELYILAGNNVLRLARQPVAL